MKRLLLCSILGLMVSMLANGQIKNSTHDKISFKTDANLAFGQGEISRPNVSSMGEGRLGAQFYAGLELPISEGLYFNPGLAFNMKGTKTATLGVINSEPLSQSSIRAHANFIKLPLYLGYRHTWSKNTSLSLQVGTFFSYAISAGIHHTRAYTSETASVSSNDPSSNIYVIEELKTTMPDGRFDMGLCSAIQFGYDRYYIQLSTDYGLMGLGKGLLMIGTQSNGEDNNYITSVRLLAGQVCLGVGIRL